MDAAGRMSQGRLRFGELGDGGLGTQRRGQGILKTAGGSRIAHQVGGGDWETSYGLGFNWGCGMWGGECVVSLEVLMKAAICSSPREKRDGY